MILKVLVKAPQPLDFVLLSPVPTGTGGVTVELLLAPGLVQDGLDAATASGQPFSLAADSTVVIYLGGGHGYTICAGQPLDVWYEAVHGASAASYHGRLALPHTTLARGKLGRAGTRACGQGCKCLVGFCFRKRVCHTRAHPCARGKGAAKQGALAHKQRWRKVACKEHSSVQLTFRVYGCTGVQVAMGLQIATYSVELHL